MKYLLLLLLSLSSSFVYADDVIEKLGDRRWIVREATQQKLYDESPKYYRLVLENVDNPDLEIRWRCRFLAFQMSDKVPLEFFTQNPKYWKYKLEYLVEVWNGRPFEQYKELLESIIAQASVEDIGPYILKIYDMATWRNRCHLYKTIGKIADHYARVGLDNPYLKLLLKHFSGTGYDELRVIMALSKVEDYKAYQAILKRTISMGIKNDSLYYKYDGGWYKEENSLKEAYISALQNFPQSMVLIAMREFPNNKNDIRTWQSMVVKSLEKFEAEMKAKTEGK